MYAAVAVGALVLIAAVVLFARRDSGYKVDEFARARSLTTEWARRAGTSTGLPQSAEAQVADQSQDRNRPQG
jgi:hypothetical protein